MTKAERKERKRQARLRRQSKRTQQTWQRNRFAEAAIVGLLASAPMCDRTKVNKSVWARVAYDFADAMLKESERRA